MQGCRPAKLTLSQAPDQAVPGAAGHRHPGQAQAVLQGLRHLEAADGGHWGCLRCGAEGQALEAGVPRATPGRCPPPQHSRVVTTMETGLPSRLPMSAVTFTV